MLNFENVFLIYIIFFKSLNKIHANECYINNLKDSIDKISNCFKVNVNSDCNFVCKPRNKTKK